MSDERSGTFLGGVALAVGLVIASAVGGWAFVKGKRGDQTITVTGSARKRIKSDLVIWRAGVSYQAPALAEAYRALSESVPRVNARRERFNRSCVRKCTQPRTSQRGSFAVWRARMEVEFHT